MKPDTRLPDFLIIGAGKSGTTAVLYFLSQHPQVFFPKRKEPNFFAIEGMDMDSLEFEESKVYHSRSIHTLEDYKALFNEAGKNQILGENSNLYMSSERAIENIKKYVPEARLIALLRHPAERLISRYNHLVREDVVPEGGVEAIFDRDSIWWKRPDLVHEGFYGQYLEKYFEAFPQEQLKVILYDDFRADSKAVIQDLCQFIGVDPNMDLDTEMVLNKSGKLKDNLFNRVLGQNGLLINGLKKTLPGVHRALKKNVAVRKTLTDWRNKNLEDVELPPDFKERLTQEIYRSDIIKLEKVLGRSLKHWYMRN